MKKVGFLTFLLICSHVMASRPMIQRVSPSLKSLSRRAAMTPNLDLCSLCTQFTSEFLDQLLNIILNAGVVGGCSDLCSMLADKTGSKIAGEVCDVLCSVVGIKEFIGLIDKADLDPIYYCELMQLCKINDNGDARIANVSITPKSVHQGDTIIISLTFVSRNGTGTGEIVVQIDAADGLPLSDGELEDALDAGTYTVQWKVNASPDPNCDPTQGPCEQWIPGNYSVSFAVCSGQCGSKHPHSQIYDEAEADFSVVG